MIQRIQSLLLLFAALAAVGTALLPLATVSVPEASGLFQDGQLDREDAPALLIFWGVAALIAVIAIFLFKRRKTQVQLAYLYLVVILAGIGFGIYLLLPRGFDGLSPGYGLIAALGGIVLVLLARRFIQKDESLVKSMDRLR